MKNNWELISIFVRTDDDQILGEFDFPACAIPQKGDWVRLDPCADSVQVVDREIDSFNENYTQEITIWVNEKSSR